MNDDKHHPDLRPHIEPELEARLVAAVLGESSAFEAAELERLIAAQPELGIFKRRIEAVHGLVGAATRPEQAPLRLAPERRAKILAAIGGTSERSTSSTVNAPVLLQLAEARRKRRKKWIWASSLAASFMFASVLAVRFVDPPSHQPARPEPVATVLGPASGRGVEFSGGANDTAKFKREESATPLVPNAAPLDSTPPLSQAGRGGAGGGRGGAGGAAARSTSTAEKERQREDALKQVASAADTAKRRAAAPPPAASDLVVLSPFEVRTDKDVGYAAGNTLTGGRVDTPLAITPGSISVMTKEFMDDFGISDMKQASRFTSGSELGKSPTSARAPAQSSASYGANDGFLTELSQASTAVAAPAAANKPVSALSINAGDSLQKRAATDLPVVRAPAPATTSLRTETRASVEPVSTFSLHVSDVSFRLAQTALARGETPDPSRIRPEEFYNAFDYGDPSPTTGEKISARIEQSAHPVLQQRNLVRIAMKVASSGRGAGQPLHLTLLLDTSGSMEREDRAASVRRALEVLGSLLGKNDRVTLIGFALQPRLFAENLPGDQAAKLVDLASRTPFAGGTNLEEALKLAGELARHHRDPAAQNRIVLLTDGAANLGNADPAQLATMVESLRQQTIALDACGIGTDGLDDAVLEALTRKGDGRYYVINSAEEADAGFARKLAGAFRPAAENVKVQVRFNPARVGSYRLIGFEEHRLREEDFRNDQVDAAELAADEAAVALYQVEVLPQGEGELGDVFVRFRDPTNGAMVERSWTMLHEPRAPAFDRAPPSLQLAGTAALLAEKLRGGDAAAAIDLGDLVPTVNTLRGRYTGNTRVQELVTMFEQLRRRNGR